MKRIVFLAIVVVATTQWMLAQSSNRLERTVVKSLEAFYRVNEGGFQVQPVAYSQPGEPDYTCYYLARNEYSGFDNFYDNGKPIISQKCQIRPFVTGSSLRESIFVTKFYEQKLSELGYGKESVIARGMMQSVCDSVITLFDDGYVFKAMGNYYHSTYKSSTASAQTVRIVWPERRVISANDTVYLKKEEDFERLSGGNVYYLSSKNDGHYYYLYRDAYMPNTVLVVDGKAVELFGVFTYDDLRLKYSYNGKHWMAVVDGRLWVDGVMKSTEGYTVSDFFVNDSGDYMYKAAKKEGEINGETVVLNGHVIRRDAQIGYFGMNANQQLKFHFLSGGQCFVYEEGSVANVTKDFKTICYVDDLLAGRLVKMCSADGVHCLTYVSGKEGLEIDGTVMCQSMPFQVVYDQRAQCFQWNAIEETKDGHNELVVYKFHCRK